MSRVHVISTGPTLIILISVQSIVFLVHVVSFIQ